MLGLMFMLRFTPHPGKMGHIFPDLEIRTIYGMLSKNRLNGVYKPID
jgi:hypothetical protein